MLNKKKIFITIFVLLVILSLSVLSIFAFEFRQPNGTGTNVPASNPPSLEAVQNLVGIINFQIEIGQLRASDFKLVFWIPGYGIHTIVAPSDATASFTYSGNSVSISFSDTVYLYLYQDGYGFVYKSSFSGSSLTNNISLSYLYYSDYPVASSSFNFTGFNSQASFGTNNLNTFDSYSYYEYIYNSCVYREERESTIRQEAQSEGESIGFEEGAEAGYFHGYDIGYADGLDEGEANGIEVGKEIGYETGYESGYADGLDDGYDTGYADGYKRGEDIGFESGYSDGFSDGYDTGYETGYESGYSDGYETGFDDGFSDSDFKKPGQIIAQFWRYRDDSEYQGVVWFCTTNYNGNINFRWCTEEEIYSHYLNCEIYDYVYDTNLYFQKNPLEFHYFVPQIVRDESPYSGALSVENVEYRFVDLYNQRAVIELDVDHTIIGLLNDKYDEGIKDSNALVNGVASIAKSPVESLRRALDFEIFGINVGAVAVGLVAILFAIWAYNKIRKLLPI